MGVQVPLLAFCKYLTRQQKRKFQAWGSEPWRYPYTPESMRVVLTDGREITVPLVWFPRLWKAAPEQRAAWEFIGRGVGIHWEEIDEDISVPQLLGLPCE